MKFTDSEKNILQFNEKKKLKRQMTDAVDWKRIDFSYSIVEEHFEHV